MPRVRQPQIAEKRRVAPRESRRQAVSRRAEGLFAARHVLMCRLARTILKLAALADDDDAPGDRPAVLR